jgi:hypothetical protein
MSLSTVLTPPIDPTVEKETITFDFGPDLGPNETVVSIASITCSVVEGTDATPSARLIGSPVIGTALPPKGSGVANGAVLQFVGTCVAGVLYQLQCVVNTSAGQVLSLRGNLPCANPPGT